MDKQTLKEKLKEALFDKDILNDAYEEMIKETKFRQSDNESLNYIIETNKNTLTKFEEENEKNKDLLLDIYPIDKDKLVKQIDAELEQYKREKASYLKEMDKKNYYRYVNDLLDNSTYLKYSFFSKYTFTLINYVYDISVKGTINNHSDIREYKKDLDYIQELNHKILQKEYLDNINYADKMKKRAKEKKPIYEQLQLDLISLSYTNKRKIRVNKITNDLSNISDDNFYKSQDYKMAKEIQNLTFNIENESIKESKETIQKLNKTDLFVLNAIVDIYEQYGVNKTFTNTQIANLYFNENPSDIKKEQKEIINKSIEKLTSTKIKVGFTSEVKGKVRKLSTYDYMVKLTPVKYETETTTYYYSIDKKPLYYQYLIITGNKQTIEGKTYNSKLLTSNITGVKKTEQWQQVRYYLLEQINTDIDNIYIDMDNIYLFFNLDAKSSSYRVQKTRIRKQTEQILSEFKKEYKYNLKPVKNDNKVIIGFKIEK